MAEQDLLIGHAQFPAQQGAALGVAGSKPRCVDAVRHDRKGLAAVQHLPGFFAAGKAVGKPGAEKAAHKPVQPADKVRLIGGVVAVAAPHGDARPPCHGVVKHAEAAVMAVDDAPLRVGGKQTAQLAQIAGEVIVLPDGQLIDAPAQRTDLVIKKARFIVMIQKIELHLLTVESAVDIHDKGFHAACVHGGHDL